MKRLFYILALLIISLTAIAQETPPTGLKAINSQFYIHLPDSTIWQMKGIPYNWHRVAKYKEVRHLIDSIATASGTIYELKSNKTATSSSSTSTYPNWLGLTNYVTSAISNNTPSFTTIANMQAYTGTAPVVIVTDALRGGVFNVVNSTYTDNGGTIFSSYKGGNWHLERQYSGRLMSSWFNIIGDFNGTAGTDNAANFIKLLSVGQPVYITKGKYMVATPIMIDGIKVVDVDAADSTDIYPSTTFPQWNGTTQFNIFEVRNFVSAKINNITIYGRRTELTPAITNWQNYIYGLRIASGNRVEVTNVRIFDGPSIAMSIENVTGSSKVYNYYGVNNMYHGIWAVFSPNLTIQDSYIRGLGISTTDVQIGGINILVTKSDHVNIIHNHLKDSPDTGTKTEGCDYVRYEGNWIENAGKDGIKVQGYTAYRDSVNYATVTNNMVSGLYNSRIDGSSLYQMFGVNHFTFIGNKGYGTKATGTEYGLIVKKYGTTTQIDGVVMGNEFYNTLSGGISFNDIKNITISNNIIKNKALLDGIVSSGTTNAKINNNTITKGNINMDGCGDFSLTLNNVNGRQIDVSNILPSQNITIDGNISDSTAAAGVSINGNASTATVQNFSLRNNTVTRSSNSSGSSGAIHFTNTNLTIGSLDVSGLHVINNGSNTPSNAIFFQGTGTYGTVSAYNMDYGAIPVPNYFNYTTLARGATIDGTEVLTHKDLTSGTNTFPTFNQNTTGNANTATALQNARTIQGVSFNGTANINLFSGTGFLKFSGTTPSYDNSTYLTSITSSGGTLLITSLNNAEINTGHGNTWTSQQSFQNSIANQSAMNAWALIPTSGQWGVVSEFGVNGNGNLRIFQDATGKRAIGNWLRWSTSNSRWEAQATTTVGATRTEYGTDGSIKFYNNAATAVTTGDPLTFVNSLSLNGDGTVSTQLLKPVNIYSTSTVPSIAAGAAAGTSPTITIVGNNQDFRVTIVAGTLTSTGLLATITMSNSFTYPTVSIPVISGVGSNAAAINNTVWADGSAATVTLNIGTTPLVAGNTYIWHIHNGGY